MMKKYLLALFLVVVCSLAFAQTERKTAVAVMDLRGSGLSETDAKFLTERLMIELQRTDVFDVLERGKMDEILKEQGFQQTGACDQTSCLVEAGRMLPVQKMIGGSVGKFGETFSIQIRLIDLKTAKVEKTATKDFEQKMDYLLTDGMKNVAISIIGIEDDKAVNNKNNFNVQKNSTDSSIAYVIKLKSSNNENSKLYEQAGRNAQMYEMLKEKYIDRVIINKGVINGIKIGDIYETFRVKENNNIIDPVTKEVLDKGIKIIQVAYLKVEKIEDKYSECSILKSKNQIKVGDKVYKTDYSDKK